MKRIALVSSEPVRERMAGIGIRYLELARRLPAVAGVETVLISPATAEESERALAAAAAGDAAGEAVAAPAAVRRFDPGELGQLIADCDAVVAQGQLANDVLLAGGERPVAIDLYDPWLVENLHYHDSLGLDPYRNDHATWVLQLAGGDFFLCSSEEQRGYYLGWLSALGRVNPQRVAADPDLAGLIAAVPFGVPAALPPHRHWLEPRRPGERRILFGGLYDWYDPWTLLAACERLDDVDWTLLLIANPNPEATPQRLLGEVEADCRRRGWWGSRVRLVDWVPTARRYDLLRDVDLLAAPHRPSLETRLSLRTRFLDAAACGLPVVVTEGGAIGRLVAEHGAGWVVPPGDPAGLAVALGEALGDPRTAARRRGAAELAAAFAWDRVLAPLAAFCRDPRADATKERYAFRPATVAPPDRLHFRLRRRLARLAARETR
ncbi:MAG TPA: glycosyltransferase family 4 protein [Thermoanaerobaculia bacterium]|nr:glycosyltransferase family 4 protein [Thermoanaerobaculia bacterium]